MTEQATPTATLEELARQAFRQQLTQGPQPTEQPPSTVPDQDATVAREPGTEPGTPETSEQPEIRADAITAGQVQAADDVLSAIGAPPVIVVVPDDAPLGTAASGNAAVTIKQSGRVEYFKTVVKNAMEAGRYAAGVGEAQRDRVAVDVIVVKSVVLRGDPVLTSGTIWHEYGHVKYGAAETGDVFAFELECLRKVDDDTARRFIDTGRKKGDYYTEAAVEPGLDKLAEQMAALGRVFKKGQKAEAAAERAATRLEDGKHLRGRPARLKTLAKATTDLPAQVRTMPLDDTFPWAGYTWRLVSRDMIYTIKIVSENNRGREQFSGTAAQLKNAAGAQKEPPLAPDSAPDTAFSWDGSSWKLLSSEPDLDIQVVSADAL